MKKVLFATLSMILIGSTSAYGKTPAPKDENTSIQAHKKVNDAKIEMIFITQEGCRSCKIIKAHMEEEGIKQLLNDHFILETKDLSESRSLPNNLEQPIGTPTIYFLDENGEELIETMVGGKSEKNFTKTLKEAIEAIQKQSK